MKIAYVTDQILPATATDTFQLVSMASALGQSGVDVTLVTPARRDGPDATSEDIAAYYRVEPTFALQSVRSMYPLFRGVEKVAHAIAMLKSDVVREADVLYTRNLPIVTAGLIATNTPLVYETYRPWPDWNRVGRPYFNWVAGRENFLGAILHSDHARNSYLNTRIESSKLLTAYNGFDASIMEPRLSRDDAREQLGLPVENAVVSYVGSVSVSKGIDDVLEMARNLPDVQFIIVGSKGRGPIEAEAEGIPNVTVLPWRPLEETVPYLFAADVLIVPPSSRPLREIGNTVLPIKTFLYLAAGRAILAPATPDVSEVLHNNVNAVLVEPDNPKIAAMHLRELLDSPQKRARLAREAVLQSAEHSWDGRARRVREFIDIRLSEQYRIDPHH